MVAAVFFTAEGAEVRIMTNDQAPMTNEVLRLSLLIGHWDLVIGHSLSVSAPSAVISLFVVFGEP
jgi:hypothetical protein